MLTAITEIHKEEPHTSTKTSPSLQNIILALEAKKKTQLMNRSADLWSIYLQQFKQYPLPLIPLKTMLSCQSPWPLPPKYNPIPLLEEQAHQEGEEEVPQAEAEEVHQEKEEEAHPEEGILTNLLKGMENPWAHYQQSLKEITQKLRASSKSSPPISLLTTMSQLLPHLSKGLP